MWTCVMNMYMHVMCVYEHVCTCKDQKRSKPSGAGLTGSCELSDVSAENETQDHARAIGTLHPELFSSPVLFLLNTLLPQGPVRTPETLKPYLLIKLIPRGLFSQFLPHRLISSLASRTDCLSSHYMPTE